MPPYKKRLFVALKVTPTTETLQCYNNLRHNCRFFRMRWVEPHLMHLTLKFFGSTDVNAIPAIKNALAIVAQQTTPFDMELGQVGVFGSRYAPRTLWFGVNNHEPMQQLFHAINNALQPLGYDPDGGNFVPHLTIARIEQIDDKKLFQKVINTFQTEHLQPLHYTRFILYQSILRPQGPIYKEEAVFDFGKKE